MNKTGALIQPSFANPPINRTAWFVLLTVLGSLLITISAKIKVELGAVDMSLQTLAIFAIAATFGLRLGTATVLLYLAEGAMGFPVFQSTPEQGGGLPYMLGPTGGYLAGFVVMAAVTGWAADRGWWRNPLKIGAAMLAGEAIMLTLGGLWLAYLFGTSKAIAWGIGPFIVTDVVKLAIAACAVALLGAGMRRFTRTG